MKLRLLIIGFFLCTLVFIGCENKEHQHQWEAGATQWKYKQYLEKNPYSYCPCYLFECNKCGKIAIVRSEDDLISGIDVITFKATPSDEAKAKQFYIDGKELKIDVVTVR